VVEALGGVKSGRCGTILLGLVASGSWPSFLRGSSATGAVTALRCGLSRSAPFCLGIFVGAENTTKARFNVPFLSSHHHRHLVHHTGRHGQAVTHSTQAKLIRRGLLSADARNDVYAVRDALRVSSPVPTSPSPIFLYFYRYLCIGITLSNVQWCDRRHRSSLAV
jgi:hypothetical protein